MDLMDNGLQQLDSGLQPRRVEGGVLGRMVAFSLILHVISSVVLLSPRPAPMQAPAITYLDLKEVGFQEPADRQPPHAGKKVEKIVETQRLHHNGPPPAEPLPETARMLRDVQQTLDRGGSNPEVLQERSIGLGLSNGYFSSIAEGETLRSDIREYYFALLREINQKWCLTKESRQGTTSGAIINIVIARNGEIVQKKLVRRSGNRALDKAMLKSLEDASPFPPLPQAYEPEYFSVPLKFIGPSHLFS